MYPFQMDYPTDLLPPGLGNPFRCNTAVKISNKGKGIFRSWPTLPDKSTAGHKGEGSHLSDSAVYIRVCSLGMLLYRFFFVVILDRKTE
uniref:Uncharacterized protein n=1 Tax=Caenorhabditis japonica TaxID=281687 RepID=A0A8R1IL18_CAEJA